MIYPKTPAELLAFLDAQDIDHRTHHHPPVFRVQDGAEIKAAMSGAHTKNLFLKDAKGRFWLISALGDTRIDLKRLPAVIGSARLSFGSSEKLWAALGVHPGSVTAFALINDPDHAVSFVLDKALLTHDIVNFHPLSNEATTALTPADLMKFLNTLGVQPLVIDFTTIG